VAVNKPVGDNARKGGVRQRSPIKITLLGIGAWLKRNKKAGKFMAVKKSKKKFNGGAPRKESVVIDVICSTSAIAQPVDARINAPEQKLNNPKCGGLRLQYQRQGVQPGVAIKPAPPTAPALDPRKSIFDTDVDTVSKLTFFDVMDQLRRQSNDPTLTPLRLFQQWWDTAARHRRDCDAAPGTAVALTRP
jgi:hypothetical protein